MTIYKIEDDPKTSEVLRGIYPILNIKPETDVQALLDWAVNLPDAGIRIVQVRVKQFEKDAVPQLMDELVSHLKGAGLSVIINDFVELVKLTGADGVHIGYEDFPIFETRAMLGQKAIIGASSRNFSEALHASGQGASYVAAGSIFKSPTKGGIPVIGVGALSEINEHINNEAMPRPGWGRFDHIPVCAIGGITKDNLKEIWDGGASMAAVIGAVQDADDPVEAAKELVETWKNMQPV